MNLPSAIERLRNVVRRQHKSLSTEDSYVFWLRHYVTALKTMPGSLPSEQKLELGRESLSVRSPLESILGGLHLGRKPGEDASSAHAPRLAKSAFSHPA